VLYNTVVHEVSLSEHALSLPAFIGG
jgi:hypothetical protein